MPPRAFYSVFETAIRWSVAPFDIVGWATERLLELSAVIPPTRVDHDRIVSGVVGLEAADVLPLFRANGSAAHSILVRRVKIEGEVAWLSEPIELVAADVLILRAEVEKFERKFCLHSAPERAGPGTSPKPRRGGPGAPARYDWDAFYGALARRIHDHGIPATKADLVRDMLAWFEEHGADHMPDESTIARKITAVWRELSRG